MFLVKIHGVFTCKVLDPVSGIKTATILDLLLPSCSAAEERFLSFCFAFLFLGSSTGDSGSGRQKTKLSGRSAGLSRSQYVYSCNRNVPAINQTICSGAITVLLHNLCLQ